MSSRKRSRFSDSAYGAQPEAKRFDVPKPIVPEPSSDRRTGTTRTDSGNGTSDRRPPKSVYAAAVSRDVNAHLAGDTDQTTLWIGDLETWEDEMYLENLFRQVSPSGFLNVKVARDRSTAFPLGYGFVEFRSNSAAAEVLDRLANALRPGNQRRFKLNWASGRGALSLHIGNLDPEVTDEELTELFSQRFSSLIGAKVACNEWGDSRGFGFVRFRDEVDFKDALLTMHHFRVRDVPINISIAQRRPAGGGGPPQPEGQAESEFKAHMAVHGPTSKRPQQPRERERGGPREEERGADCRPSTHYAAGESPSLEWSTADPHQRGGLSVSRSGSETHSGVQFEYRYTPQDAVWQRPSISNKTKELAVTDLHIRTAEREREREEAALTALGEPREASEPLCIDLEECVVRTTVDTQWAVARELTMMRMIEAVVTNGGMVETKGEDLFEKCSLSFDTLLSENLTLRHIRDEEIIAYGFVEA